MPHATVPSPGLQALILCGPGSSLSTFTSNPTDLPKAVIPIANRPMVWYPLDWCYRVGVNDITLVVAPESESAIQTALDTNPALTSLPSPKPDILAPKDLTQTTGTAELLRLPEVQRCITTDFVILPCDLVSELDGSRLVQQWMTLSPLGYSSRQAGGLAVFYPTYGLDSISHKKDETDFLATVPLPSPPVPPSSSSLRPCIEQMVLNMPTDTLNDRISEGPNKGYLSLRQSLLHKHGKVRMQTKHRDAHIYIFPQWVKTFAARSERFESLSEDLLSWWAKAGWQDGLAEKLGLDEILKQQSPYEVNEDATVERDGQIDVVAMSSTKSLYPAQEGGSPTFASRVGAASLIPRKPVAVPPLLAYVQPAPSSPLIRRVDTALQVLNVSLYLAKRSLDHPLSPENKVHPSATLEQQARVSQEDCLIAENVKLGFRSNIKESVIGANCEVGRNVRLTRCLLMENVTVGDGVQLIGCIVGRRAKIEGMKPPEASTEAPAQSEAAAKGKRKKSTVDVDDEGRTKLADCEVAPNFVVEAGTEAKGEKFMGFDTDDLDEDDLEDMQEDGTDENDND